MEAAKSPFDVNIASTPPEVIEEELETQDEVVEEETEDDDDDNDIVTDPNEVSNDDEEDSEEETDDDESEVEFDGRTGSSIMAEDWKKQGLLPEDFEVKDDLTSRELQDAAYSHMDARKTEEVEERFRNKGYDDRVLEYAEFLAAGGNPQMLQTHVVYDQLANYKTDDEESATLVVRAMLEEQGIEDDMVDDMIESLSLNDKLTQKAEDAKKFFSSRRDTIIEEEKSRQKEFQKQQEKQVEQIQAQYKKIIGSGKVGDLSLSKAEAKNLEDSLLKPTEVIVNELPDGTKQRMKITKFQKTLNEIQSDPDKMVQFAYMVLNGPDAIKTKKGEEARNELLDVLDGKKKYSTVNKKSKPSGGGKKRFRVTEQLAKSSPIQILKHN